MTVPHAARQRHQADLIHGHEARAQQQQQQRSTMTRPDGLRSDRALHSLTVRLKSAFCLLQQQQAAQDDCTPRRSTKEPRSARAAAAAAEVDDDEAGRVEERPRISRSVDGPSTCCCWPSFAARRLLRRVYLGQSILRGAWKEVPAAAAAAEVDDDEAGRVEERPRISRSVDGR
jgi:hypothetical protein